MSTSPVPSGPVPSGPGAAAEPLDPRSVVEGFATAWNRHDADALAALFTEDADFVNVTGLWWNTRERIRAAHVYGFERIFGTSTMRIGRTEVRRLGDGAAVVHARVTVSGQTAPDGSPAEDRRTVFTFVVRARADGAWQAVAAQNTDIPPGGMETHLNAGPMQTAVSYRATT